MQGLLASGRNYCESMGIYDLISGALTVVGTVVLVYKTVSEIADRTKLSTLEKLCTKWVIFVIFLKIEYMILALMEIIPLGALALLVVKFLLFMPDNPISHKVFKKISAKLEKVKMDEYHSYLGIYLSTFCKHIVMVLLSAIKKIAEYVNTSHVEQVEQNIMEMIKTFEYKKAAVQMRSQTGKSQMRSELSDLSFSSNASDDQTEVILSPVKAAGRKSMIGERMSKIIADYDQDDQENLKLHAELMIVKPNKALDQKARYEETKVEFSPSNCKITFTNQHKAVEEGTLTAVKWITKNMINIELVLSGGRSKVIKLLEKADVAKWVEPVCSVLEKQQKKE